MKTSTKLVSVLCGLALAASCRPGRTYNFSGNVYDGATGKALTSYTMTVSWENTTVNATVDKTGRFYFAGLPSLEDYQVNITATGYRAFTSSNHGLGDSGNMPTDTTDPVSNTTEGFVYSAVLFPSNLKAPATEIDVFAEDSTTAPSGTLRLDPVPNAGAAGGSAVGVATGSYNQITNTGTTKKQVWANDLDTAAAAITKDITGGKVTFAAGDLVYGVSYRPTVLGTGDYSFNPTVATGGTFVANTPPATGGYYTITAGTQTAFTLTLVKATDNTGLAATYCNIDTTAPTGGVTLTVVFNQAIANDPTRNIQKDQWDFDNLVTASGGGAVNGSGAATSAGATTTSTSGASGGWVYMAPPQVTMTKSCNAGLKFPRSTATVEPLSNILNGSNGVLFTISGNSVTVAVADGAVLQTASDLDTQCQEVGFVYTKAMLDLVHFVAANDPHAASHVLSDFSCPSWAAGVVPPATPPTFATKAPIFVRKIANP